MFGSEILYLCKVRQMGYDKIVRSFYEWQIGNMKFASQTKIVIEELDCIGLRFIWQNKQEKNANSVYRCNTLRCSNIQGHVDTKMT